MSTLPNKQAFIDELFKLPIEVLRSVLTDKSVELLKASNPFFEQFIEKLFELPAEVLQPILTEHALELMNVCDFQQKIFVQKLNELAEGAIKSIFTQDNLTKFFAKHSDGSMNLYGADLFSLFEQQQLTMPVEAIESMTFQIYIDMTILKFTPAAISLVDSAELLHPTVCKILAKTYFKMEGVTERKEFVNNWAKSLNKIIESNESIAMILEKTADVKGDIFMVDSDYLPDSDYGATIGVCNMKSLDIFVATARDINEVTAALVHEFTHKLIQITHNNEMLPYAKGATFEEMEKAIAEELELEKKLNLRVNIKSGSGNALNVNSWLTEIMDNYPTEKIAIELLPHLTGQITESILKGEAINAVSKPFANIVWKYLHQQLELSSELPDLPDVCCYSFELANSTESELINMAIKILASEEPHHDWLNSEAGTLAFKSLSFSQKNDYFEKLFALPQEELVPILTKHISRFLEISVDNSAFITMKLFSLSAEEELYPIFANEPHKFLKACGESKILLISKLFELSDDKLKPILTSYGDELLQASDEYYKQRFIDKLKEFQNEEMAPLLDLSSTVLNYPYPEGITVVYSDSYDEDEDEERGLYVGNVLSVLNESFNQTLGCDLPKEWELNFAIYIWHDWDM